MLKVVFFYVSLIELGELPKEFFLWLFDRHTTKLIHKDMDDQEFLYRVRELAIEMDKLADEFDVRDRMMSVMVVGVTTVDIFGDASMQAVYSYNAQTKEELEELTDFMKQTYQPPEKEDDDLDDLLNGLGISLN